MHTLLWRALALSLLAFPRTSAAASWSPDRSISGGRVNRLVQDGSRLCAATPVGVYCRERGQDAWRPAFFEGKYVETLARTRSGWVVFLYEPDPKAPSAELWKPYISRDGGARWSPGRLPWQTGGFGPQALGDSLIRHDPGKVELSRDGGETWESLPLPPDRIRECALSRDYVLCATNDRIIGYAGSGEWSPLSSKGRMADLHISDGRIYFWDSLYALSVYGKAGLERRMPPLPGFYLLFASDSLLIASSTRGFAFAKGGDSAWTLCPAPYSITPPYYSGGVWSGGEAFLRGFDSPRKARLEGGTLVLEPYGQGIPSKSIRQLHSAGGRLLAVAENAIWQAGADGSWRIAFQREALISQFLFFGEKAMVGSWEINGAIREAAPPLFSEDSGKTWQRQPSSLPGFIHAMARQGDRYVALTLAVPDGSADSSGSASFALYEAAAWMGPWTLRTDRFPIYVWGDMFACGRRLFAHSGDDAFMSLDTGKTWMPTGYPRVWDAGGDRVYAVDTAGALWESGRAVEQWTRVVVPMKVPVWPTAVNRTAGEPLIASYSNDSGVSRVYPLPGASPMWSGVETFPVPGIIESLASRDGALYAVIRDEGMFVLDMRTNGIRARSNNRPSGNPRRSVGWRRVDGRAVPAGASHPPTPVFRAGTGPSNP